VARYSLLDTARHTWSRSCMQHYWIICSHSSHCRATPPAVSSFQAQSSSTPVQPQFSVINWTLGLSESLQSLCWPEGLTAGRRGSRGPSGRSTDHHNQCRQQKPKHDQLSAHCRLICMCYTVQTLFSWHQKRAREAIFSREAFFSREVFSSTCREAFFSKKVFLSRKVFLTPKVH
jgi:hypothetical protein